MTKKDPISRAYIVPVRKSLALVYWFNPSLRLWCAYYATRATGNQIGDTWYDPDRDALLVNRAPEPETDDTKTEKPKAASYAEIATSLRVATIARTIRLPLGASRYLPTDLTGNEP
jgi:hypothetical protein